MHYYQPKQLKLGPSKNAKMVNSYIYYKGINQKCIILDTEQHALDQRLIHPQRPQLSVHDLPG